MALGQPETPQRKQSKGGPFRRRGRMTPPSALAHPGDTPGRAAPPHRESGLGRAKPEPALPAPLSDGVIALFRFLTPNYCFRNRPSQECSVTDRLNFENCLSLLANVQAIIMKMTTIITARNHSRQDLFKGHVRV